jgi:hypothetical protein
LLWDVAEVAEEIIRENCKELDIEIITNFLEKHIKKKKNRKAFIYLRHTYDKSVVYVIGGRA